MPTVVGVRLRFSKTLWYDPTGTEPCEGDRVIVETERGEEFGTVVAAPFEVEADALPAALKPIARMANEDDHVRLEELTAREAEALPEFRKLVEHYRLAMKPVDVQFLTGGDKIVFYFSADERVDFRELVKDLAAKFHARIDMRQVGVRDEARAVGGVGHCGQQLCCSRFGGEFQPVSIRMAKEQDLPLNPLKISGLCGRLMCCLRYEYDAYKDFKSRAPKRGAIIDTPSGLAKVAELNTPRETIRMRLEDGTSVTIPLAKMECGKGGMCPCSVSREVLEDATGVVAAPPVAAEPPRQQRPSRPLRGAKPEAAKPEAAESEAPREGSGRRRRRRKSGGAEGGSPEAARTAEPKQGPKQAPKAAAKQPQGGQEPAAAGDKPAKSGRRRRRRRSSGGGGGGGAENAPS